MYYNDVNMYNDSFNNLFIGLGIFLLIIGVLLLAYSIVMLIANWKLLKKAGKGGWEALIPYYNVWVLTEISGLNSWWFWLGIASSIVSLAGIKLLALPASVVSLFASFNIYYNISKKFNKSNGEAVCAGIFWSIFVLIYGFSKNAVYDVNAPVSKNGVFGTPEVSNTVVMEATVNTEAEEKKEEETKEEVAFCRNCGTKFEADAKFCPICGKQRV